MKPLILITNDDGIRSPGIRAAAEAACHYGDLLIAAPIRQQTAMSRAFPVTEDLGIIEKVPLRIGGKEIIGYGVHGSPAYAVAHGILEIADRKPDLCVSGINYGGNMGLSITCSGTIGAAWEADSHDVPTLAVSLEADMGIVRYGHYAELNFDSARKSAVYWIDKILKDGMPRNCNILNVNVPSREIGAEEYRFTRLERRNYYQFAEPAARDQGIPFRLDCGMIETPENLREGGDIYAVVAERITSVTPLTWDMSIN